MKSSLFSEWQANALAMRIAMLQDLMVEAFQEARATARPYHLTGNYLELWERYILKG